MPVKQILIMKTQKTKPITGANRDNRDSQINTMPGFGLRFLRCLLLMFCILCVSVLNSRAQVISNIVIGVDYNSNAWAKVNYNNNTFVAWLNRDDLTNGWFFQQITNLDTQLSNQPASSLHGIIYPSNTWSLAAVTNPMPNFSFWAGNSNGVALVSLWLSNGVPYIKQLSP
jgi:hypothetical protein